MGLPKKIPRGATLRLEFVTCGRCPRQHGPYWYAYWKDYRGVTRKQYIGKQMPQANPAAPLAQANQRQPAPTQPMTKLHLDIAHRDAPELRRRAALAVSPDKLIPQKRATGGLMVVVTAWPCILKPLR